MVDLASERGWAGGVAGVAIKLMELHVQFLLINRRKTLYYVVVRFYFKAPFDN